MSVDLCLLSSNLSLWASTVSYRKECLTNSCFHSGSPLW